MFLKISVFIFQKSLLSWNHILFSNIFFQGNDTPELSSTVPCCGATRLQCNYDDAGVKERALPHLADGKSIDTTIRPSQANIINIKAIMPESVFNNVFPNRKTVTQVFLFSKNLVINPTFFCTSNHAHYVFF